MISVKCPNCSSAHPAEKEVLGKKVRCEDCGFAFVARKEKLEKISVRCPQCGVEHRAPQAVEGKWIRCNDCGHQFVAGDRGEQPTPARAADHQPAAGVGPPPIVPPAESPLPLTESPFPEEPYPFGPEAPKAPPQWANLFLGRETGFRFELMPGEEVIDELRLAHTVLFIFRRGETRVTLTNRRILYNAAKVFSPLDWILLALFQPLIFYYLFRIPANRSVSIPLTEVDSVEKRFMPNWLVFLLALIAVGGLSSVLHFVALWSAAQWEPLSYLPGLVVGLTWLAGGPLVLFCLLTTRIVRIDVRSRNNRFAVPIGSMVSGDGQGRYERFLQKISSEIERARTGAELEPGPT